MRGALRVHMRRVSALLLVFAAACAAAPASEQADGAPLGDERLRVRGPALRIEPGVRLADQVLYHSVIEADVSLDWSGVQVDASIPPDFWAEVQGYLLDVTAGTDVTVSIDGPRVQTLIKRVGEDGSVMSVGNEAYYFAEQPGTVLVMVIPSEIQPGSDHIDYAIEARTSAPADSAPAWSCPAEYLGTGDGCDCGCGAIDPDCGDAGCAEPGCQDAACGYCWNENGTDVGCSAPEW